MFSPLPDSAHLDEFALGAISAIVDVGLALPILDAGGMGQQVTDATLHRSGVGVQREPVRQTASGSSFWKYYSRTASRRSASR